MDYEVMDQIYDTLARNDGYEQFNPDDYDNLSILKEPTTNQAIIAFTRGGKEYILRLEVNDRWQVFDQN